MKGHILILSVNILFAVSMPVFKYLLTADVSLEAITIMRATFACIMVWLASLFMPKEKVLPKDLRTLFICALCGVGITMVVCSCHTQRTDYSIRSINTHSLFV